MPPKVGRPRKSFAPSVEAEVIRRSIELGESDQRIADWLLKEHAIKVSRGTVQRVTAAARGPEPPKEDPGIVPIPVGDQEQLDKAQANLFRAQQLAYEGRRFQDQARAASELLKFVQARGKPTVVYPSTSASSSAPEASGSPPRRSQAEIDRLLREESN